MTDNHVILGVHVQDRLKQVGDVQKLFSQYGCNIKTRLGLHDVDGDYCASTGIVLLEMIGKEEEIDAFAAALNDIEGVDVKKMSFDHS